MIRRRGASEHSVEESSSSDEEDAFSALSRKKAKKAPSRKSSDAGDFENAGGGGDETSHKNQDATPQQQTTTKLPVSNTSSMKRHHGTSGSRKAKMEALLQELKADKKESEKGNYYGPSDRFVPEKKGSFVEPGEEHLTTNIFVGNLDPSLTEEDVTELFRQFGDLYSVKIMWPRTPEERARNRNTGFVCFMSREDAQEAMDAFNESDPFHVGRRLMMRWGKNVKKSVKRGTGGIAPIRKKTMRNDEPLQQQQQRQPEGYNKRKAQDSIDEASNSMAWNKASTEWSGSSGFNQQTTTSSSSVQPLSNLPKYDPAIHASDAIRVISPRDPERLRFITTVASFVAKDGSILERKMIESESGNPDFAFLTLDKASNDPQRTAEHIFYRWRVYAFCQGDGFDSWRTEPFVMIQPHGRFWIPPSLNREAAWREEQAAMEKEEQIRQRQEQRRRIAERKDFMTGRQLEQAKFGRAVAGAADGGAELADDELEQFDILVKKKLCASREAICEAMAFCFNKSGAAKQISNLLKEALLEDTQGISVDTRIARLFLLSDVLFNSQQPGVRNAFLYRDAIEAMAPEVFESLGKHGKGQLGRMTMNKLRTAAGAVLSAWTNWSVYNPTFLDELHARFDGREIVAPPKDEEMDKEEASPEGALPEDEVTAKNESVVIDKPRGDWTEVSTDAQDEEAEKQFYGEAQNVDGKPLDNDEDVDGTKLGQDDLDGEPLEEEDVDGEPIGEDDVDGEPIAEDEVDGEPIAEDDVDGEALADDDV